MLTAYQALLRHWKETVSLKQLIGLAHWDQQTYMPVNAARQRADQLAVITRVIHERIDSGEFGELIARTDHADLDRLGQINLRLIKRERKRVAAIPADLAAAISRASSLATQNWKQAKESEDVAAFLPFLAEVVSLKRQEADALDEGDGRYNALFNCYEPDTDAEWVHEMFIRLRRGLTELRDQIRCADPIEPIPTVDFPRDQQLALARQIAGKFGYDWKRGRLDLSVHPFTCGDGDDVRITTRVDETDLLDCLFATIHETGHALYEQNIAPDLAMTPAGMASSLGIHESQSRFLENQIARGASFIAWLFDCLKQELGDFGIIDAHTLYCCCNSVSDGFIRTMADEVQYNLHILLRFDLERALVSGDLEVGDLEVAWNERFLGDFGVAVDKPSNGMLQDTHWASGSFGYFPTYTLGNIYSACLHARLIQDLPELDRDLRRGDPTSAVAWMQEKVHRHGASLQPLEIIQAATGETVSEMPLLDYLRDKFGEIYGLG